MEEQDSVGRSLASLLAEYGMNTDGLCRRSGLRENEVSLILRDILVVTPAVAEKLGRAFYSPGFWLVRQACLNGESSVITDKKGPASRAK